MGGGSRVVVDEFLAASAPEEAFTDAASLVVVFVSIPLFPSVELSPISGFISDRLTKRFVVFALAEMSPAVICDELDSTGSPPPPRLPTSDVPASALFELFSSLFCFCCWARRPMAIAKAWSRFFKVCVSLYASNDCADRNNDSSKRLAICGSFCIHSTGAFGFRACRSRAMFVIILRLS
jgi:hypothetical protein